MSKDEIIATLVAALHRVPELCEAEGDKASDQTSSRDYAKAVKLSDQILKQMNEALVAAGADTMRYF